MLPKLSRLPLNHDLQNLPTIRLINEFFKVVLDVLKDCFIGLHSAEMILYKSAVCNGDLSKRVLLMRAHSNLAIL